MRIALFGSGSPISVAALRAVAERFEVVAVVIPEGRKLRGPLGFLRSMAHRRSRRALRQVAGERSLRVLCHSPGREEELAAGLARHEPDLVCIATYPHLLRRPLLTVGRLGAIGLHPSLLPRHRGPDPLFWTYFHDDAEAGVTTFWLDEGEDTGDLILQEPIPLPRGLPGVDLYREVARCGAALLARTLEQVEAGSAPQSVQNPSRASREPEPARGTWSIDFTAWGAERVWHVLRGVGWRADPLGVAGSPPLGPARAYVLGRVEGPPGTLHRTGGRWHLACRDGFVELDPPPWRARLRALFRHEPIVRR